jgi:hypothetical protein|tara:strand:- start:7316 stop:7540 length:225 start_codon:yes stop_codon:yes gene_type:complete
MNKIRIGVTITRTILSDVFVELDDVQFDKFITDGLLEGDEFSESSLTDLFYEQMNEEDINGEELFFNTEAAEEY